MTLHVPLACTSPGGNSAYTTINTPVASLPSTLPPFVKSSATPDSHLNAIFDSILKARRITVVCGAGISVEAGIPDFRSPDGLFQSLKRDNPKESLSSGKDLFDASVFKSTEKTALFCRMIASLASLSSQSEPTAFHDLLRTLDDRGQLLRVYTQNIDALEMKAGLSFGVPEFEERFLRSLGRVGKAKGKARARVRLQAEAASESGTTDASPTSLKKGKTKSKGKRDVNSGLYSYTPKKGKKKALPVVHPDVPANIPEFDVSVSQTEPVLESSLTSSLPLLENKAPFATSLVSSQPSLNNTIPRCIPLHGTLLWLHCQHCTQSFPLNPPPPSSQSYTPPRSVSSSSSSSLSSPYSSRTSTPTSQEQEPSIDTSPSSSYVLHALLSQGTPPPCPSCTSLEQTRALVGKRLRGVGKLRPSVVLYGEEHREGESVGEAVRRDLCGIEVEMVANDDSKESSGPTIFESDKKNKMDIPSSGSLKGDETVTQPGSSSLLEDSKTTVITTSLTPGSTSPTKPKPKTRTRTRGKGPDLLLVVGTSLRVPGTKRIVREFSKAVKSTTSGSTTPAHTSESSTATSPALGTVHLPTPTPPPSETSPRLSSSPSSSTRAFPSNSKSPKIKTIYLNKEFPLPARDWEDVFDVWVQGDVQVFARALAALIHQDSSMMVVGADEDAVTVAGADEEMEMAEDAMRVRRKRKIVVEEEEEEEELDTQESLHRTCWKKKKKRRRTETGLHGKSSSKTASVLPLTPPPPPTFAHRSKSKHASKTVTCLGPVSRKKLDSDDDDQDGDGDGEDGEDEDINMDVDEAASGVIGSPGFQLCRFVNMDIIPETETEMEMETEVETEVDNGTDSEGLQLLRRRDSMFSPTPTPPPSTTKRKVVLRYPTGDPPLSSLPPPPPPLLPLSLLSQSRSRSSSESFTSYNTSRFKMGMNPNPYYTSQHSSRVRYYPVLSTFEPPVLPSPTTSAIQPHNLTHVHSSYTDTTTSLLHARISSPPPPPRCSSSANLEAGPSIPNPSLLRPHNSSSLSLIDNNGRSSYDNNNNNDPSSSSSTYSLGDESFQRFAVVGWDAMQRIHVSDGVLPVYA